MIIPTKFKVAGFEVNVESQDKLEDNNYGYWNDVTDRQIANTFYHELFHSFQFYSGKKYCEVECNMFANFMLEFEETKQ